jgi:enoyl-CoA hydratase
MLAEAGEVEAKAMAVAGQLAQLPGPAYAWNRKSMRKATLDRIRASLGAHHKV